ncbi:MAG: glycosyltransferase family 4 protein [Candidatus Eiseniibacteriota bacterium]|nr:MAG: glycosyltransferase family 4 protein [Candidatus Eisenbacteria bacterium]
MSTKTRRRTAEAAIPNTTVAVSRPRADRGRHISLETQPSESRGDGRRSLNVAIVTHAYYPQFGGVTEHVHHVAVELRKRGHRVTIITCGHRNSKPANEADVVRLGSNVLIKHNGAYANLTVGWNIYGKMKRVLREGRFDVVHVHCPLVPVLPLAATRTSRDAVLLGTFHASAKSNAGYFLFRPLLQKFHRRIHGKVAVSLPARDFVHRYFGGDYRIIPNGVDPERFSPEVPPLEELMDGTHNILFVGRPDPRKGLEHLIRAMEVIHAKSPSPVRLVVIGDGPGRPTYEAAVADHIRDSVRFVGSVTSELLPRYFASAHVFCSPATRNESFGIVLLEAMASGVPVVASDIPGYRSVVSHKQDGLLTEASNHEALAETILELLRDKELREKLGARGRQKAFQYSWASVARQTEDYYFELMDAKVGARARD